MTGKELFGVIVRTLALLCCLWGFWNLLWGFLTGANLVPLVPPEESARGYFLQGIAFLIVGGFFLRNASIFVRFAYHDGEEGGGDQV